MTKKLSNDLLFIGLFIVAALGTTSDLVGDIMEGNDKLHLVMEILIVISAVAGLGLILREMVRNKAALEQANSALQDAQVKLENPPQPADNLEQYQSLLQRQYDDWSLTPSEREVASLLLKGLSFDEVANVRNTREKTVRQQASSIYRKSGLNGRHEFAAWFMEDLLHQ